MSSIYYPDNCGPTQELPLYTCKPCIVSEKGRIRSVFLYRDSVAWLNQSSTTEWQQYILAGDVIVINSTQGEYDGGTTEEQEGFGDLETVNGGTTHILRWLDPNLDDNCDFYNALKLQSEWKLGWKTSSKIWFSDAVATYTPSAPVQNNIKSIVTYNTQAKWVSDDIPCPFAIPPGIFDRCFAISA